MDGLLLDTERGIWQKYEKRIIKEYGKELTEEMLLKIVGTNRKTCQKQLKIIFGDNFPAEEYYNKVSACYKDICEHGKIELMPGAIEILDYLKKNNIKIALGTSTQRKYATAALKNCKIFDYFDFTVCGDEVTNGKPDPEIYMRSVEHYNYKPEECIVFEDSSIGATAAYTSGINLILVPDTMKPNEVDKEKALAIVNSLQEAISVIDKINN